MNDHTPRPNREPTQAAEGLPRWRWTLAEFERFIELGILTENDRVELIGGELVPMAAKGLAHENVKFALEGAIEEQLSKDFRALIELGWRPDADTYCEPDMVICGRDQRPYAKVLPADVLLVIEIADSTLKSDLTTKAALYARLGVREYWTVNAYTLETHVHLEPSSAGYQVKKKHKAGALLKPRLLTSVAVRLGDLGIEG